MKSAPPAPSNGCNGSRKEVEEKLIGPLAATRRDRAAFH